MKKNTYYGIIDIGSNTVRLVVYQIQPQMVYNEVQNVKLPVRLYQYLNDKNELSQEGIDKLIEVMEVYNQIIAHYPLEKLIATATAVIRQSKNSEEVLSTVKKVTGISLRLLSEEEEAFYGQYAIARTTAFSEGYTVDMGGGSTEITYFKDNEIVDSHSFPFGVVTLKNKFFKDDLPGEEGTLKKVKNFLKEQFETLPWLVKKEIPIIAIGGSSRNIASVHEQMTDYPVVGIHQYEMKQKDLKETLDLFTSLSLDELQSLDGLSKDRADIIIPANLTFISLMEQVDSKKFIFCNNGLREGLLMEEINRYFPEAFTTTNIAETSVQRFVETYQVDVSRSNKRIEMMNLFVKELSDKQILTADKEKLISYLAFGAQLYLIGSAIEEDDSPFHSFYLLANSNLNGFTHKQRIALALLASYKNKSFFKLLSKPFKKWFTEEELDLLRRAGGLTKFVEALNVTSVNDVRSFSLTEKANKYVLAIEWSFDPLAETYRGNRQKKHLENVLQKKVVLDFKIK